MGFPRTRFSTSPVRRQVRLLMKAADSRCGSLCACLPASGSVPGSELLLTLARKNGKKKGGGRGKKTTSRRSPLTCARQPRRARQPYTRADQ